MSSIREDLKAFVDGELPEARMREIEAAIASDPALRQEVEYMRVLGLEIKRAAAEPDVLGKEKALERVRRPKLPWWNPMSATGRLAYAGALFVVLAGATAVFFPMMNQAKFSSRFAPASEAASSGAADMALSESVSPATPADSKSYSRSREEEIGGGASAPSRQEASSNQAEPPIVATPSNRKVIKNAEIRVKVASARQAHADAEKLAKDLGGYVEDGNVTASEEGTPTASAVLRVPSRLYETAMNALRGMGEVLGESSNAHDVTAQYADLEGRIRVLRSEEEAYLSMLRAARKLGEIMEIRDRINRIRQELASYEQQRKALANESALSTIRASFVEKVKLDDRKEEGSGFEETWAKAVRGLSAVGTFLGNLAIYLFVFAPIWLPPVALFWWLGKKAKG
jgi:hypothetical protein